MVKSGSASQTWWSPNSGGWRRMWWLCLIFMGVAVVAAEAKASIAVTRYEDLMGDSQTLQDVVKKAYIGREAYGILAIKGVPGLAAARHAVLSSSIDKFMQSNSTTDAALVRPRSSWPGLRHYSEHVDPLQSGFVLNVFEDVGVSKVDPVWGKNQWPEDDPSFKTKHVNLNTIIYNTVTQALGKIDDVVDTLYKENDLPQNTQPLKEFFEASTFSHSAFKLYFHDYSRQDDLFGDDAEPTPGNLEVPPAITDASTCSGEPTPKSLNDTDEQKIDNAAELSSMRTASTSSRGSKPQFATDSAAELSSMRTASTSSRSAPSATCSASAPDSAAELSSMRTASTSSRGSKSKFPTDSAAELSSMRTASTSSRSPLAGSSAADSAAELSSMRTASTSSRGSKPHFATDSAAELSSMRTASTSSRSAPSGTCSASAPDSAAELPSMRTASTSSRGSKPAFATDSAAELSSMRTASTSSRSAPAGTCSASACDSAAELSSMRTASTSSRGTKPAFATDSAAELSSMRTASTSSRSGGGAAYGSEDAHKEAAETTDAELDPFWFPYHIEPNTFSVLTQDTYFDATGNMVEGVKAVDGKPLGFMSVNALGDVVPMRELMDENDLAILMGAGGQMLTGGMLRAGLHGVRRDGSPDGLGRMLYFHAFYGNSSHTWEAPPPELEAAGRAELSVTDTRILDIGDPIVKSMTGRSMNQVLYDFRRQFQRLPVGFETNGVQEKFETLSDVIPVHQDQNKIVIDVLTDLTCPIVYLALKRLKQALVNTGTEAMVTLRYHMLLINPDMSEEGEDIESYISKLKNMTIEQYSAPDTPLNRAASGLGYAYAPYRRVMKPLRAHAAVQAAEPALRNAVYDELALRYNEHGDDINNVTIIAEAYRKFNIDASNMTELAERLEANKVPILSLYEELDSLVTTVPHFMVRDQATRSGFELDGALKQEAFDAALQRIARVPENLTINGAALASLGINLPRGTLVPGFGGKTLLASRVDRYASITINSINLRQAHWEGPPAWPYTSNDFARDDENDDGNLYAKPNFAKHIAEDALQSLTDTYRTLFASSPHWQEDAATSSFALLDVSSSWVSHYPSLPTGARVAVQGMNEQELLANEQATDRLVQDLNKNATLPYAGESFDFVTSVAGMQYMTSPRDVIREWHRVLKPGGIAIVSFSNRYFEQKATAIWKRSMAEEVALSNFVETCFRFAPQGEWENINSVDISPHHTEGDPMWVVMATKKQRNF